MKYITPEQLAQKIENVQMPQYKLGEDRVEVFLLAINGERHTSFSDALWAAFGSLKLNQSFKRGVFDLPETDEEGCTSLSDFIILAISNGELLPAIATKIRTAYGIV